MIPYKTQEDTEVVHYDMCRDIFVQSQPAKPTERDISTHIV